MSQSLHNISPFDPASIDVEKKNMPISSLITMLENDIIDLSPAFQRKQDLWTAERQSQLIESILLKLPLPSMYFEYDHERRKYVVIDGLQRLCTLKNFAVDKKLKLRGLEFLQNEYGGMSYNDLSFTDRLEIGLQEIAVNVLKVTTPDYAKFVIFKRLNSGGTQLNNQEIRNALYNGEGTRLLVTLSELPQMQSVGFRSQRLLDQEVILRFMAFKRSGYGAYPGRMEAFLTNCLIGLNNLSANELEELKNQFIQSLSRNIAIFGDNVFRNPNSRTKLPSTSMFDALMVAFSELSDMQFYRIETRRPDFVEEFNKLLLTDDMMKESIGSKSDRRSSAIFRYNTIQSLLRQYFGQ